MCKKMCPRIFQSPEKHSLIHSLAHSLTPNQYSNDERCSGQPKRNKSLFVFLARLSYDLVQHRHLSISSCVVFSFVRFIITVVL